MGRTSSRSPIGGGGDELAFGGGGSCPSRRSQVASGAGIGAADEVAGGTAAVGRGWRPARASGRRTRWRVQRRRRAVAAAAEGTLAGVHRGEGGCGASMD